VVNQAKKEKAEDYRPELKTKASNIGNYDVIILGTPVWWYTMTPAMKSFIAQNNFKGKTILPFCTHGGGGASSTFIDMKKMLPDSEFLQGIEFYEKGDSSTDKLLSDWLKQI
jgi:flavodoxin